jgi:pyruvate/2-oxoglutarate dehydrogenase complex dihydrolipoamide dehydrogenase (E3) component
MKIIVDAQTGRVLGAAILSTESGELIRTAASRKFTGTCSASRAG